MNLIHTPPNPTILVETAPIFPALAVLALVGWGLKAAWDCFTEENN